MLVFNPESGFHSPQNLARRAEELLNSSGWQVHLQASRNANHLTELARQAARQGMDAFFIVGGDGSARCAAAGLIGSRTALGVLPGGTANVWAQEIGLLPSQKIEPQLFERAVHWLAQGQVFATDLGACNGEVFLLWSGIGLDGLVVHHTESRPHLLKSIANLHFAAETLWQIPGWAGMDLHVRLDEIEYNDQALLVLSANTSRYMGGLTDLDSNVKLDDGRLDMWFFTGSNPQRSFEYAFRLLLNKHNIPPIHHFSFCDAEIITESPLWVHLDGDPLQFASPLHISVHPQSLRVIVPQQTPRRLFLNAPLFSFQPVGD